MDAIGDYLLLAYAPLEVMVIRVNVLGPLTPSGNPTAKLTIVRELSIMSLGQQLKVSSSLTFFTFLGMF